MMFLLAVTWERTASNTILYIDDMRSTTYLAWSDEHFSSNGEWYTTSGVSRWPWANRSSKLVLDKNNECIYLIWAAGVYTQPGDTTHDNPYDVFVRKYDLSGNPLWSVPVRIYGPTYDFDNGVDGDVDSSGNLYVAFKDSQGYAAVRKVSPDGTLGWAANTQLGLCNTDPAIVVFSDGYVYVAWSYSGDIYLNGVSRSDGSVKWASNLQIDTGTIGTNSSQYPDMVVYGGKLYIAWRADSYDVFVCEVDPATQTVGTTYKVNKGSYTWGELWYGSSSYEHCVSMCVDPATGDLYFAFAAKDTSTGYIQVHLQKVNVSNLGTPLWGAAGEDPLAQQISSDLVERVPDVFWDDQNNLFWVCWLRGGAAPTYYNAFDSSGNPYYSAEKVIEMGSNWTSMVVYNDYLYFGTNSGTQFMKFNLYGAQLFSVVPDPANYCTQTRWKSKRVLPGTVYKAKLRTDYLVNHPSGSSGMDILFSGDGGTNWSSNADDGAEVDLSSTTTNNFIYQCDITGDSLHGVEQPYIDSLAIEATDVSFADLTSTVYSDGSNAYGELVFSEDGSGQEAVQYATAGETVAGYFFIKNMGNHTDSFRLQLVTTDDGVWDVTYKEWVWNGTSWQEGSVISDGTAAATYDLGTLAPYDGTNNTVKAVKVEVTAPATASEGDYFVVEVKTEINLNGSGVYYWHDTAHFKVVYTTVRPDLMISKQETSGYIGAQIYNTDGYAQSLENYSYTDVKRIYYVKVYNRGDDGNITVTGTPSGSDWKIEYFYPASSTTPNTNIPGSGESIYLAHAEEAIIRVEVTPLSGASEGDVKEIYVTGSMTSGAVTRSDTVKITVTRADAAADLKVESQDNYSRFVDFGQTVALQVEVTNNSSWEQTFYIKENTSTIPAGWTVAYLDGATDITADVQGSGYSFMLSSGASKTITLQVTAPSPGNVDEQCIIGLRAWGEYGYGDDGSFVQYDDSSVTITSVDIVVDLILDSSGDDVYESSPTSQIAEKWVLVNTTQSYTLALQEDGDPGSAASQNTYQLSWSNSNSDFTVDFQYNSSSISSPWTSDALGSGESLDVSIDVTSSSNIDTQTTLDITCISSINPGQIDTFRIIQHASVPPDIYGKRSSPTESNLVGNNQYDPDASFQQLSGGLSKGSTSDLVFYIWVDNDRTVAESVVFYGTAATGGWSSKYELGDNSDPALVTTWTPIDPTSGYSLGNLNPGDIKLIKLTVSVTDWGLVDEGDFETLQVWTEGQTTSLVDKINIICTCGAGIPEVSVQPDWTEMEAGDTTQIEYTITNTSQNISEGFRLTWTDSLSLPAGASVDFKYQSGENLIDIDESSLSGSGWTAPVLGPGESLKVIAEVTIGSLSSGTQFTITLKAASDVDPTSNDSAQATVQVVDPRPDLLVMSPYEGTDFKGDDEYADSSTPVQASFKVASGAFAVFTLECENDDVATGTFNLTIDWQDSDSWKVTVYDTVSGDITSSVRSGGVDYRIDPGANVKVNIRVFPLFENFVPDDLNITATLKSKKNPNRWDLAILKVFAEGTEVTVELTNMEGKRLPGRLEIADRTFETSTGVINFEIFPGVYTVKVNSRGYLPVEETVEIPQQEATTLSFVLLEANVDASSVDVHSYPNPAKDSATIVYNVPQRGRVRLLLYDLTGRLVARLVDEEMESGTYVYRWNLLNKAGEKITPGVYVCVIDVSGKKKIERIFVKK